MLENGDKKTGKLKKIEDIDFTKVTAKAVNVDKRSMAQQFVDDEMVFEDFESKPAHHIRQAFVMFTDGSYFMSDGVGVTEINDTWFYKHIPSNNELIADAINEANKDK